MSTSLARMHERNHCDFPLRSDIQRITHNLETSQCTDSRPCMCRTKLHNANRVVLETPWKHCFQGGVYSRQPRDYHRHCYLFFIQHIIKILRTSLATDSKIVHRIQTINNTVVQIESNHVGFFCIGIPLPLIK